MLDVPLLILAISCQNVHSPAGFPTGDVPPVGQAQVLLGSSTTGVSVIITEWGMLAGGIGGAAAKLPNDKPPVGSAIVCPI